jgi:hypothetical protein
MMAIGWFDAKEAQDFGLLLASFYIERVPLEASGKKEKTQAKKKEVINKLFQQIERNKPGLKLNIYKKAKLGNSFQWALKEAGYDLDFVNTLTKEILLRL